ncbi:MAG: porin family protein [Flavobacteriales bacterium]
MKKIISTFMATLFVWSSISMLNAQTEQSSDQKARFGFKISPALSWIRPDFGNAAAPLVIENAGWRTGFSYGVHLEFLMLDNLYLQTGLDIQSHSAAIRASSLDLSSTNVYKMRYVEIPVLFKARTNEIGYFRYFGQFGFGFSGRTRVSVNETVRIMNQEVKTEISNANSRMNFFRVGMIFGLGAEYSLSGNTALVMGVTYNNGITNMLRRQDNTTYDERGFANFLQLNLGILF